MTALLLFGAMPLSYANINMSMSTSGATSGSVSMDKSESSNTSIRHANAGISGGTITINTKDKTTIAGANIAASDALDITTRNLDVSSVQDSDKSRSTSMGLSVSGGESGVSSGSVNGAEILGTQYIII